MIPCLDVGASAAGSALARRTGGALRLVLAITIAFTLIGFIARSSGRFFDFRAFYCAGQAVLLRADPYREHPLHECERAFHLSGLGPADDEMTVPAPVPGAVLDVFALFALLPAGCAALVWTCAGIGSLAYAIALIARLTRVPPVAVSVVIGVPAVVTPLNLGQSSLFVLLALIVCATQLAAGRPRVAALAALGTIFDPPVFFALVVALGINVRASRAVLAIGVLALAAAGLAGGGPARELEYWGVVLPAHARANLAELTQFSASSAAYALGVAGPAALVLGSVWYAASVGAGIIVARRLIGSAGPAGLALIPTAFAVFGGTHTHLQQLGLAIPAFLLCLPAADDPRRRLFAAATFIAATPWLFSGEYLPLSIGFACAALLFARALNVPRIAPALAALGLILPATIFIAWVRGGDHAGRFIAHVAGNPLAERSWSAYVAAKALTPHAWLIVAKAPTAVAFAILLALLLEAARRTRPAPAFIVARARVGGQRGYDVR